MALDAEQEDLAVQYVLGELPAVDARDLERRMQSDLGLAAEVRRLRDTLGLLPYATAAEPPPDLRGKILAAAEVRRRPTRPAAPRRIVWSRFVAAAAATIALVLGVDAYRTRRELAIQQQLAQLLLEPNVVRTFALQGGGAVGTVALDLDAKRGAVVLRGASPLPMGQIYRLWAQVADRAVPCGDFTAAGDGTVRTQFRVPVEAYTAPIGKLFVTVEPSGRGETPTGPVVMQST